MLNALYWRTKSDSWYKQTVYDIRYDVYLLQILQILVILERFITWSPFIYVHRAVNDFLALLTDPWIFQFPCNSKLEQLDIISERGNIRLYCNKKQLIWKWMVHRMLDCKLNLSFIKYQKPAMDFVIIYPSSEGAIILRTEHGQWVNLFYNSWI